MAQINPTVGAIGDNAKKIKLFITKAKASGCDLVVFPELALVGYPPEDLLLKASFVDENIEALKKIASEVHGIVVVIGFVGITKSKKILQSKKSQIYNSAAVIEGGLVRGLYHKMHLPNYGVFDEERYFSKGSTPLNFKLLGVTFGLGICEDIWEADGPAKAEVLAGAEVILNINASPYHHGKVQLREEMLAKVAKKNKVSIIYSNCVGGQDELVFDGESMV
ncbi:MAG: NAD+ synthase, partial [Deltaproteobacteria bacterium]|nr:NAD+ synthase [Deltaproteobacteria bacterium]